MGACAYLEIGQFAFRAHIDGQARVPGARERDRFFMRRYSLAEIENENERRVRYAWYGNWPRQLLTTTYPEWRARWLPE